MIWWNIYMRHTGNRAKAAISLSSLRPVLNDLGSRTGLVNVGASWSQQKNPKTGIAEWSMTGSHQGVVQLKDTPDLRDLKLTLLALVDTREDRLRQFTAMLEGIRPNDGTPWIAAVHLEDDDNRPEGDRKGTGACGHAAWHCHVGPDLSATPKVRVPLPALKPADALRWVLTTIIPAMEPAPWERCPT